MTRTALALATLAAVAPGCGRKAVRLVGAAGQGGAAGVGGAAGAGGAAGQGGSTALGSDEEFVGPFPSWKSVRDFGAKGDGATDDTDALQAALAASRDLLETTWSVLYLPAGQYRISRPLVTTRAAHYDHLGISIVGEDPATTQIVWDGPAGGNMLELDAWYAKLSRLSFDGRGRAAIGLYRGNGFGSHTEHSDLVFRDMAIGISFGREGSMGQVEQTIQRCQFVRCSDAGVRADNANAVNLWVRFGRFEECGRGVHVVRGNAHVWGSVFLRSTLADIGWENLLEFSFVGNTSVGSRTFVDGASGHTQGAQVLIQGNHIYDVTGPHAIVTGTAGPWVLLDNVIRSREDHAGAAIRLGAKDQTLVGNTCSVADPIEVEMGSIRGNLRVRSIDQKIVAREDLPAPSLALPPVPPNLRRKVFEVAAGSGDDAQALQGQIDAAAREPGGTRPVVHLAKGVWSLPRAVTVPAGAEIQIVGDGPGDGAGRGTHLEGGGGTPVLVFEGPSRAVVRDLAVNGVGGAIRITNADQAGGRVLADQLVVRGPGEAADRPAEAPAIGVHVDGVENADVTVTGFDLTWLRRGAVVTGGPNRRQGGSAGGQVTLAGGVMSAVGTPLDVVDGGELVAHALWAQGDYGGSRLCDLATRGRLTVAAAHVAVPTSTAVVRANGFRGTLAIVASALVSAIPAHRIEVGGDGSGATVVALGTNFPVLGFLPAGGFVDERFIWADTSTPPARAALYQGTVSGDSMYIAGGAVFADLPPVTNKTAGVEADDALLRDGLAQLRATRIEAPWPRPPGTTDLRLMRVITGAGKDATVVTITR